MSRLTEIFSLAKERRADSEKGQKIPSELFIDDSAYLTRHEIDEVYRLKQMLPTFGQLKKEARERLKNRIRGRK